METRGQKDGPIMRLTTLLYHDIFTTLPGESGFQDAGSEHYKLPIMEFDRHLEAIKTVLDRAPCLVTELKGYQNNGPRLALTFDDGGLSYYNTVASRLEQNGWRGHCFITTSRIGSPGFLHACHLRTLQERGHVIGSHSVTHPTRFAACSRARQIREWTDSRQLLEDVLGVEVTAASVPGGYYSMTVAQSAAEAGFRSLFTSEPVKHIETVDGCLIFGRFTLRCNHPAEYAARLAADDPWAATREWTAWNAKKVLKRLLGTNYQLLAQRISVSKQPPGSSLN